MWGKIIFGLSKLPPFFVAVILSFDGFSILVFGLFFLVLAAGADPADYSVEAKDAALHVGEIVAAMTFLYLVICIIAPIYWRKRKRIWVYIVLGLGLIHLAVCSFLFALTEPLDVQGFELFAYFFWASFTMNLVLPAIIILSKTRSESILQNGKA